MSTDDRAANNRRFAGREAKDGQDEAGGDPEVGRYFRIARIATQAKNSTVPARKSPKASFSMADTA